MSRETNKKWRRNNIDILDDSCESWRSNKTMSTSISNELLNSENIENNEHDDNSSNNNESIEAKIFKNYRRKPGFWKNHDNVDKKKIENKIERNLIRTINKTKTNNHCHYSYGIICKKYKQNYYVVQNRKFSIGFEQFVKSHWNVQNVDFIQKLLNDMSVNERKILFEVEYYKLWLQLSFNANYTNYINYNYAQNKNKGQNPQEIKINFNNNDDDISVSTRANIDVDDSTRKTTEQCFIEALNKFNKLLNGYWYNSNTKQIRQSSLKIFNDSHHGINDNDDREDWKWINLLILCESCTTFYMKPQLEFPKGKKNHHNEEEETNLQCAQREFTEETGIPANEYNILSSLENDNENENVILKPKILIEKFIGLNKSKYIYTYYLAEMNEFSIYNRQLVMDPNNFDQMNEISDLKWATKGEIVTEMRPDNFKRQEIICQADSIFSIFSHSHSHSNSS